MARLIENVEDLEAIPEGAVVWQEFRKPRHYQWVIDREDGYRPVDDAANVPDDLPVLRWPVMFDEPRVSPMVMYQGILGNEMEYLVPSEMDAADHIRMQIRIWDTKPTDEERAATPWPTRQECKAHW